MRKNNRSKTSIVKCQSPFNSLAMFSSFKCFDIFCNSMRILFSFKDFRAAGVWPAKSRMFMYCVDVSVSSTWSKFNSSRFASVGFFMQSAAAMQSLILARYRGTGMPEETWFKRSIKAVAISASIVQTPMELKKLVNIGTASEVTGVRSFTISINTTSPSRTEITRETRSPESAGNRNEMQARRDRSIEGEMIVII